MSDYLRQRMSDETLVTTRVSVKRAGNDVGDLDVVVCDPHDKSLAIFEIRWHLSTDGNIEIHRIESAAADKRAKLELLRDKIESKHAVVRWPKSWPDVSSFSRRWFVLTRDVLVT